MGGKICEGGILGGSVDSLTLCQVGYICKAGGEALEGMHRVSFVH